MASRKFVPESWRADAFDPAFDAPDTKPIRRKVELAPGVYVYPEFFEEDHSVGLYHDLHAWA
jgi:hypothetical protein